MAIFLGDFEFIQVSFNTSIGFEASSDALLHEKSLSRQFLLIWVFSQPVQSVEILEFFIAKGLDLYQTSSFGDIKTVLNKVSSFENLKGMYETSSSSIRYRAPILPDFEILGRILEEYYYCKDHHLSALEIAILFTEPLKLKILHEHIREPPDIGKCLVLAASSHKPWEMLDCISETFRKSNQDLLHTVIQTKAFTITFIFEHGSGRLVKILPLYTSLLKDPSDQADMDLCYLLKSTDIGQQIYFDLFDALFNIPGLKQSTQRLLFEAFTKQLTFKVEPCEISGTVNFMLNSFELQFAVNNLSEYAAKFGFEFLIPSEFKLSLLEECFREIAGRSCCTHCKTQFLESRRNINIKGPFEALLMSHEQQQLARGANQIKLLLSYGMLNVVCIEPIGEQFITRVESIISSGYDINSRSPDGWSILFHSALYQNWSFNILKKLVRKGISVSSFRYPQPSPIIMAINMRNTEALEFILENGGESIINIAGIMHFDHKRAVERMGIVLLITPLMLACRKGDIQIVTLLLVKGANVNMLLPDIKKQPRTALEEACYHGRLDIVALLLNNGANRVAAALDLTPPHFHQIKKLLRRHM
ncbi:hypothetical protein H072_6384 [Dactylellina haptotyla CBS 200.50]|uniref:Uncharacterized protein n=1 Tax=Dactylellina haptotyla (strain CBS 200.50) TaxID=1284197 RepID=S8AFP3_DACHA|nr:hypothetical protein H072_6384 [Dactylellina haptotyla CBS 200.50]